MVARVTRRAVLVGGSAAAFAASSHIASGDTPPIALKDAAKAHGILYGTCVQVEALTRNDDFTALVLAQCNCIVAETDMKWGEMSDRQSEEDFSDGDKIVDFAVGHGLAVRGHNLLWHGNVPRWFKELPDRSIAEAAIVRRITEMCSRYRGRVFCWDVVNEPIKVEDGRPDSLRRAIFVDKIGPEFLDLAHYVARAADPNALLVVNDYGIEYDTPEHEAKRRGVLRLLERMKKAGTPVDALGIESHLRTGGYPFSQTKLRQFFAEVATMGLEIQITELDVMDEATPSAIAVRDQLVADAYTRFLDAALAEPAVNVVVTWGLSDRYTWMNYGLPRPRVRQGGGQPFRPLPFDRDLNPKPAANALLRAFQDPRPRSHPLSRPASVPTRGTP